MAARTGSGSGTHPQVRRDDGSEDDGSQEELEESLAVVERRLGRCHRALLEHWLTPFAPDDPGGETTLVDDPPNELLDASRCPSAPTLVAEPSVELLRRTRGAG